MKSLRPQKKQKPKTKKLFVEIDAELARKMENHVSRPDGRTWRAWIELLIGQFLSEESGR